ncbi:MAG TPA: hypothetical protein PL070_18225 [Flavobacteriales bacterium]|nr:hypothetical protein [Flavobacteriales bacterium]
MRHINLIITATVIVSLAACVKAGKEVAEEIGLVPSTCGSDGARVQAEVDGSGFCADASIMAVTDGSSASITGVGLLGNTFSLQLDTLGLGTHTISAASNALMFMSTGTPYVVVGDSAGWVRIEQYETSSRRLKAQFNARVRNEMNGQEKSIIGSVDVTCSVAG